MQRNSIDFKFSYNSHCKRKHAVLVYPVRTFIAAVSAVRFPTFSLVTELKSVSTGEKVTKRDLFRLLAYFQKSGKTYDLNLSGSAAVISTVFITFF